MLKKVTRLFSAGRLKNYRKRAQVCLTLSRTKTPAGGPEGLEARFAAVLRAIREVEGFDLHEEQVMAALAMRDGYAVEMATGEGKTHAAILLAGAYALEGRVVHLSTANDYLAQRDASRAMRVFAQFEMSCGYLTESMSPLERQAQYTHSVVYGTLSGIARDYLNDQLVTNPVHLVQSKRDVLLVDEADAVLIDGATRQISVGRPVAPDTSVLGDAAALADEILSDETRYIHSAEKREITLTEEGLEFLEQRDPRFAEAWSEEGDLRLVDAVTKALQARKLQALDRDYLIINGNLVPVDPQTGRPRIGGRFEDGLHQALEKKESLVITPRTRIQASTGLKNYIGKYQALHAMGGTLHTEVDELAEVYNLGFIQIPTHKPVQRVVHEDLFFESKEEKYAEMLKQVVLANAEQRPVLVAAVGLDEAARAHEILVKAGLTATKLDAKDPDAESGIIAEAGRLGAITVISRMAGRGVDILLGGSKGSAEERETVMAKGGLLVIGVERNGLERDDAQLAGRCARQGEPGELRFLLSAEDYLFSQVDPEYLEKVSAALQNLPRVEGTKALDFPFLYKLVNGAQKRFAGFEADQRQTLRELDDEFESARKSFYQARKMALEDSPRGYLEELMGDTLQSRLGTALRGQLYVMPDDLDQVTQALSDTGRGGFSRIRSSMRVAVPVEGLSLEDYARKLMLRWRMRLDERLRMLPEGHPETYLKNLILQGMDAHWFRFLEDLPILRTNSALSSFSGKNPKQAFREASLARFERMILDIENELYKRAWELPMDLSSQGLPKSLSIAEVSGS